jgi:hypothetical protein
MVILEEETYKEFGYYPSDLMLNSHKRIIVACNDCDKIREIDRSAYRALCYSCAHKSKHLSKETKEKMHFSHKGKHLSEGTKQKQSKWHKEKVVSAITRTKISEIAKHRCCSDETRRKMSENRKGRFVSAETRKKQSIALKGKYTGESHWCWKGGISKSKYCSKWNEDFREYIRDKFNRKCFLCDKTEEENGKRLSVHHVNYDKACGCAETEEDKKADDRVCQFIPLCASCHGKVHHDKERYENFL